MNGRQTGNMAQQLALWNALQRCPQGRVWAYMENSTPAEDYRKIATIGSPDGNRVNVFHAPSVNGLSFFGATTPVYLFTIECIPKPTCVPRGPPGGGWTKGDASQKVGDTPFYDESIVPLQYLYSRSAYGLPVDYAVMANGQIKVRIFHHYTGALEWFDCVEPRELKPLPIKQSGTVAPAPAPAPAPGIVNRYLLRRKFPFA